MDNENSGKRSLGRIFIAVAAAVVLIAGVGIWLSGNMSHKLKNAGYSKEQIGEIQSVFSEDEQELLSKQPADVRILEIIKDGRYQKDKLESYLKGLALGKDPETLLTDFDPVVVELRATDGYNEEHLGLYLAHLLENPEDTAEETVEHINIIDDFRFLDGFDIDHLDDYRQRWEHSPEDTPEEIIAYVAKLKRFSAQEYFLENNLERYVSYSEKNPKKSLAEVIQAVNCNIDRPFYTGTQTADYSKGHLILVNKYYILGSGYKVELEKLTGYGYGSLEKTAAAAFKKMVDAAKKDGISLKSVSSYRTAATQKSYYDSYVAKNGVAASDRFSARPGSSEHQAGLAVDINCASFGAHFEKTKEYAWLQKNAEKYGFILRYPAGKEYITGYRNEPWHYRYVGKDVAKEINELGITFEEYYAYFVDSSEY